MFGKECRADDFEPGRSPSSRMANTPSSMTAPRAAFLLLTALAFLIPLGTIAYKLFVLNYPLSGLIPAVDYHVDVGMQVDGHGDAIKIRTYLPRTDSRQRVKDEENASGAFALGLEAEEQNRVAVWRTDPISGSQSLRYSYTVQPSAVRYVIPDGLKAPADYPADVARHLGVEEGIQVDSPLIAKRLKEIVPEDNPDIGSALNRIHRHIQDDFANRNFSGYTDALTALKLGEASCNGKSRLFAAMARQLNLPARLVGGLILTTGSKRTTHQWVEVYVNGHWVPFDTINDHAAGLPANYLTLYYGDRALFKHTSNVNFQYFFQIKKRLVPQQEAQEAMAGSPLNIFKLYATFERVGISQNLLKILLMIPFGALVVVIFRNVVGLETFGTFLPALIAAAARETGLWWGLLGFVMILLVSSWVRRVLDWMQLLHSPKMAIMLTTVVAMMLTTTVVSVNVGLLDLAHVTLFPIAILAITAERYAIIETEQGTIKAVRITLTTMLVIAACYVVMDSLFLQSMTLAFPEVLLLVIALNLWFGKWIGMRVTEYFRFRRLIFASK